MEKYDLVIKGGTVVDGTRLPRFRGDVAIRDGRIAQIGGVGLDDADTVIAADGLIVAPGFVDLHTHYDAQIQWDPYCTISSWHGVTSVALGNCGFGFAPVRPEARDRAMLMMARNEAIPVEVQREGMLWDWITFPEFLASLDRIPKGVNCLSYFPLNPAMVWVMGLEAAKSRPATDDERREMQRLFREALDAGACGFSVQRLGEHSLQGDFDGSPMPTDTMTDDDIFAFAEVLRERDEGVIQVTEVTNDVNQTKALEFQEKLAEVSGRPILHNAINPLPDHPDVMERRLQWLADGNRRGLRLFAMALTTRSSLTFSLDDWNLYDSSPAWNKALHGSHEELREHLSDPELRRQIIAETDAQMLVDEALGGPLSTVMVWGVNDQPELKKYLRRTLGDIAAEESKHPVEVMLDLALATNLKSLYKTGTNGPEKGPELHAEMMASPYTLPGLSDGGAHTKFLTDGSWPTDFLVWLVRDTGSMTLEEAHYRLSYLPAHAAGFRDRGFLREGAPADIVVYDLENLKRSPEWDSEVVYDQPAGEWRRIQRAEGYRWILVNGEVTFEDGECTGATPGALLRHGRAAT